MLLIILTLIFIACRVQKKNIYNESDYILIKVDSSDEHIDKRTFVYKYDAARKMVKNYFFTGELMAKSFAYGKYLEGPLEVYSYDGKLITIDSFSQGIKIFSKMINPDTSVTLFNTGKLTPFTSLDSLK